LRARLGSRLKLSEPAPLYEQIRDQLLEEFHSSQNADVQPIGDALLMRRFGVSRTTVRMAIAELVRRRLVKRIPGRGTFFVKKAQLEIGLDSIERLHYEWDSLGFDPEAKVLTYRYVKADAAVAHKLKVPVDSEVLLVQRIRTKNGKPASLDIRYTAGWCAHVIRREDALHLLLPVIEKRLNVRAIASEQEIWAQSADRNISRSLNIKVGAPVLCRNITLIAKGERPISTGTAHYRADLFRFSMRAPGETQQLELQSKLAMSSR
jgi:GntR family transcriptional regulator